METRRFGPMEDKVPVIGQGTWQISDRDGARKALDRGIRLGLTHVDTAEVYTGSEETIAPVIRDRRDEIFLVSKVQPGNASYKGTLEACAGSLERLGTDHLDVYLLHWPSQHPIEDTMRAMGELIDDGKIRAAGVSNFSVEDLEGAIEALGKHRLVCNQVIYHLEERGVEVEVLPFCRDNDIALVAYSPFGSGRFPSAGGPGGKALQEIGKKHGKTARQVALRFLTREAPLFTIPKAEKVQHVEDNAGGQGFTLDAEDLERIDEAFPVPENVVGVPTI